MKRVPSLVCAAIALIGVSIGEAGAEEDLQAVFEAAPPLIRELQCQDIASLSSVDLARVHLWLDQVMAPVADAGMSMDQIYGQFLADCARDPDWSAVAAAVELRKLLDGLTPQHAGGK